ncbi:HD domain-containing protein [Flavobacterium selenitireducens]|uniref:HD domain-containing protein n=1 Tax=Flavobacterium selenitireducens TaxID=2722704 RepID=UPI00168ABA52|nr:HD domain-containing protein [Flavobacterium selenitireducens]MBD3582649.1 bifunctional (p)ppGpp synthetase/guanosine-3',5'-bis(diphosphate) 3'-pyrophosphohydrolase [Flavobacterium selenitireducens]
MEEIVAKVRDFADAAHGEQLRKYSGERYIVHPIRVMETCRQYDDSLPVLAAALLHDVLEDTSVNEAELLEFLRNTMSEADARHTLQLVIEMTDVFVKKNFAHLNRRIRKHQELERIEKTSAQAQTIKYADIIDNSGEIASQDRHFAPRYLRECLEILKVAIKGNALLRARAWEIVKRNLSEVE